MIDLSEYRAYEVRLRGADAEVRAVIRRLQAEAAMSPREAARRRWWVQRHLRRGLTPDAVLELACGRPLAPEMRRVLEGQQ